MMSVTSSFVVLVSNKLTIYHTPLKTEVYAIYYYVIFWENINGDYVNINVLHPMVSTDWITTPTTRIRWFTDFWICTGYGTVKMVPELATL